MSIKIPFVLGVASKMLPFGWYGLCDLSGWRLHEVEPLMDVIMWLAASAQLCAQLLGAA